MGGVVDWFERRGEIPLTPPWRFREYGPLTDDLGRPVDAHFNSSVRGVACGIEYCDDHGWTSTRTIRCTAIDPSHPACISAYCHVREQQMSFRLDRIISVTDLRSGRMLSSDENMALFEPYLASDEPSRETRRLVALQRATRDGVFALLQVSMMSGALGDEARKVVLGYVRNEAVAVRCALPPFERVELWVDNLAPSLDDVVDAVAGLSQDRDRFARVLPWLLKAARCQGALASPEAELRELFAEVRGHFRSLPRDFAVDLRATS